MPGGRDVDFRPNCASVAVVVGIWFGLRLPAPGPMGRTGLLGEAHEPGGFSLSSSRHSRHL